MSNYLAIATVTAVLQRTLIKAIEADIEGVRVTTSRPDNPGGGIPETRVNLYLYQAELNEVWRNSANMRANRNRQTESAKQNRTAFDLHYMISFYGNDAELKPQRLMGSAIQALTDKPIITTEMIRGATSDSTFAYLADNTLVQQVEQIKFIPLDLSVEDLSKIWSIFFQTPYTLSIAYRVTAVVIEGHKPAQKALPVTERSTGGIAPFPNQPIIESIESEGGRFEPILASSALVIKGQNLQGQITQILVGDFEATPTEVNDAEVKFDLGLLPSPAFKAGVQSLQIIHRFNPGEVPQIITPQTKSMTVVESNVMPFVVRPIIKEIKVENLRGRHDELRSGDLVIQTDVTVGKEQRILLSLNEWSTDDPATYMFKSPHSRSEDTQTITVPINQVQAGQYLVRLHIDGAESPLKKDTDPDSDTFDLYVAPQVLIS
ncbi:MAG: DUF4255 domain-containing protein [Spirulinaceae cyanobacterium]